MTDPGMVADDPTQTGTQGESQESIQELYEEETGEEFPVDQVIAVALVFVAILFGIGLIYLFIQAILEFVFIESLRSEEVHVRRYFLENEFERCGAFSATLFLYRHRRNLFDYLHISPIAWLLTYSIRCWD
ncbi:hypothetical protein [Halostagnicola sp. A56]|uniref:DUF7544 domain-containing protein n=1 Tax=Halostagnicola sp. A56 TaxID=1495067 RepID=UPI0012E2374E|nr:hypothetical protein [Halostagnicola sp. A56]